MVDLERCKSVKKQGCWEGILEVLQVDDFYRYSNVDNQVFSAGKGKQLMNIHKDNQLASTNFYDYPIFLVDIQLYDTLPHH